MVPVIGLDSAGRATLGAVRMIWWPEPHRYVYHYTRPETFLAHILPTMVLRMSPFAAVNDPRESKEWRFEAVAGAASSDRFDRINRRYSEIVRGEAKLICLTRDAPEAGDDLVNDLYYRGYAHPRMWDRYAGNHSGVCLGFRLDKLIDDVRNAVADKGEILEGTVSYDQLPLSPEEGLSFDNEVCDVDSVLREHRDAHRQTLYFQKSIDWSSENEHRFVLLTDPNRIVNALGYENVDISSSLDLVIFGHDFPAAAIQMVSRIVDDRIELGRVRYVNGTPVLRRWPEQASS
jgi:hypothetical protein